MYTQEQFEIWNQLAKLMQEYFAQNSNADTKVVDYQNAKELEKTLNLSIEETGLDSNKLLEEVKTYLKYSVRTTHPQFNNQLYGGFNFEALIGEIVSTITNTSMATFEISPVATLMEMKLVDELSKLAGFKNGSGIMVTGGSNANMMAIHCARSKKFEDVKKTGNPYTQQRIFVSEFAHYSFKKAVILLGIGCDNLISIKSNSDGPMDPKDLEVKIQESISQGATPLMVASTAGSTVLGSFDSIVENDEIAKRYKLWHHVDGAWGGAALFSEKLRHYLIGLNNADSFTFDAHKLLGTGLITSFFLTKEKGNLYDANSSGGKKYLFHEYENAEYDSGKSSLQCGRKVDVLKLWLTWKSLGTSGLAKLVDDQFEKMHFFSDLLRENKSFKLIHDPKYLNVCFQVIPKDSSVDINQFNLKLRYEIVKSGKALINFSSFDDGTVFFRMVFANSNLTKESLSELVKIFCLNIDN